MIKNLLNIKPCIIGLGYVGLPVFLQIQKKFLTIGYDKNLHRIKTLNNKIDSNKEYNKKDLILKNKSFFTNDINKIRNSNFFIVTVPTPIDKKNNPDLSFLENVSKLISKNLKKGDIVIYESTVYPGTTKYLINKYLNKNSKLIEGIDYFVGYSPERVNPGDNKHSISKIKKIISFNTKSKKINKKIFNVYKSITKNLVFSSSIESAETAKVIENIQRDLNIALINDILLFTEKMNFDFNEVIRLASTKWNFLKFNPGLVGGHCLPVDPYYLSYIAKKNNIKLKTLLAGRDVNSYMKTFINDKIINSINDFKKLNKRGPYLAICGLTYKSDVADIRNSLALEIYLKIKKKHKLIIGYDYVCNDLISSKYKILKKINKIKNKIDIAIFLVNHKKNKNLYSFLKKRGKKILDPFNYYK